MQFDFRFDLTFVNKSIIHLKQEFHQQDGIIPQVTVLKEREPNTFISVWLPSEIIAERWDLPRTTALEATATHRLYSGGGSITGKGFTGDYDFGFQPVDIAAAMAKAKSVF